MIIVQLMCNKLQNLIPQFWGDFDDIAKISVTSPIIIINIPTRGLLVKQRVLLLNVLNIEITKTMFVNKYLRYT